MTSPSLTVEAGALFNQMSRENEESATIAQFIQLYRRSEAFRHWLKEDFGRDARLREQIDELASATPPPAVERFSLLGGEAGSLDEELRQLKTRFSNRIYGGLSHGDLMKLILYYKSGEIDKGVFLFVQEWRRAGAKAASCPVLGRAAVTFMEAVLTGGQRRLLRHLNEAVRLLDRAKSKSKYRAEVGFADWWKLQTLLFILRNPRSSYRTRELLAHLEGCGLEVSRKELRRFCSQNGIERDMRAGRPKTQPAAKPKRRIYSWRAGKT